jgi:hypothetical protein
LAEKNKGPIRFKVELRDNLEGRKIGVCFVARPRKRQNEVAHYIVGIYTSSGGKL